MFVLEIAQYFYHKETKATNKKGNRTSQLLHQLLDHGYGIRTRSLYKKLSNIIENQINIYIRSLFTCPVFWEQKRPTDTFLQTSPEVHNAINLALFMCYGWSSCFCVLCCHLQEAVMTRAAQPDRLLLP